MTDLAVPPTPPPVPHGLRRSNRIAEKLAKAPKEEEPVKLKIAKKPTKKSTKKPTQQKPKKLNGPRAGSCDGRMRPTTKALASTVSTVCKNTPPKGTRWPRFLDHEIRCKGPGEGSYDLYQREDGSRYYEKLNGDGTSTYWEEAAKDSE